MTNKREYDFEKITTNRPLRESDMNSRIPRYSDDADYTTNAPSYYEDLARKQKLMKLLSHRVWEYEEIIKTQFEDWDEELRQRFIEWDKNLEEFDDEVLRLLQEWMEDGTLDHIINDTIFEWKADKEYVDNEFNRVDNEFERVDDELSQKADKIHHRLNIKDFGAVGDGETDDTQSFISAVDSFKNSGGGTIYVPEGEYLITSEIPLDSNISVQGDGVNSKILSENGIVFRADGNYSNRNAIVENSVLGDHYVTVSTPSDFSPGDHIRIMSQRIATSDDAGNYQLGTTTSENHTVYFGEIREISDINNKTGQLFFRGGLIFPDYNSNDNDETHPNAKRNSTVDKINFAENIEIKDLQFTGQPTTVMRFEIGKNIIVDNCRIYGKGDGDFIAFHQCYNSEGRNCSLAYDPSISHGGVFSRNGLKTVSTVNCGFSDCEVHHGTQSVDFTYSTNGETIPNIGSYLKNSKISNSEFNSATSHGGSMLSQFTNNIMMNCRVDGIMNRSRQAMISGNLIVGGFVEDSGISYGITNYQKGAVGCLIDNNVVRNFNTAISNRDTASSRSERLNLNIMNNSIESCQIAFSLRRVSGSEFRGLSNVRITNNMAQNFVGSFGKFIDIYERFRGVHIIGNTFLGNDNVNGGIYTRGDSENITIIQNTLRGPERLLWFGDVDESFVSRPIYNYRDNDTYGLPSFEWTGNLIHERHYIYSHLYPDRNDALNLGYSSFRWRQLFATNGEISTSDKKLKTNIENTSLGIDFINKLRPVSYKNIDGDRTHYGLIAQEVEQTINDMDITIDDFAMLTKDEMDGESVYGMRYKELIPILIKAIQELNDIIKR